MTLNIIEYDQFYSVLNIKKIHSLYSELKGESLFFQSLYSLVL